MDFQIPTLGWPFGSLAPAISSTSLSTKAAFSFSALFGWWSYCFMASSAELPPPEALLFFTALAAIFRLGIYVGGVSPPFNIWGRIACRRIVIPGFDRIFITPLSAIGVAIVGGWIIRHAGQVERAVIALVITATWFVLLQGGPTLHNWRLTGQFRMRFVSRHRSNRQLARSQS